MDEWMNKFINEWLDGYMGVWMNGWMVSISEKKLSGLD
jgi:hypothetical protein